MKELAIHYIDRALSSAKTSRVIAGFMIVASVALIGSTSVASAAPNYFSVAKPSSKSQCQGGTWHTVGGWSRFHYYRHRVWVPNWQKLGFNSYQQCINYVSTPQPTSQRQCDMRWWQLGFNSRQDCIRYLKLHPGSGYGGSNFGSSDNND